MEKAEVTSSAAGLDGIQRPLVAVGGRLAKPGVGLWLLAWFSVPDEHGASMQTE